MSCSGIKRSLSTIPERRYGHTKNELNAILRKIGARQPAFRRQFPKHIPLFKPRKNGGKRQRPVNSPIKSPVKSPKQKKQCSLKSITPNRSPIKNKNNQYHRNIISVINNYAKNKNTISQENFNHLKTLQNKEFKEFIALKSLRKIQDYLNRTHRITNSKTQRLLGEKLFHYTNPSEPKLVEEQKAKKENS